MEAKDYWALAIASSALAVSGLAYLTSRASLRLARAQDKRALEREQPALDFRFPTCSGVGPWSVTYTIRNRSAEPLLVGGIRLPLSMGMPPIADRAPIRLAQTIGVEHHFATPQGGEAGDYEVLVLEHELAPGEATSGAFDVLPEPRRPLRRNTTVRLYVDAVLRDRDQTVYRLPVDRIISSNV